MNPLFRIDFSISDSLKIVRKSVLIYETIIGETATTVHDKGQVIDISRNFRRPCAALYLEN